MKRSDAAIVRRRRKGGASNGLSITAPSSITFADGDQPYNMAGAEKVVLADSVGGDSTFTVAITIGGGGTLTLTGTTGLTGSGTGTSSLSYSGSIANWNTALDGADIAGLSEETASISITMTGDTSARVKVAAISVTSTDDTAPTISTLSPADDATGVAITANLVATFSENIALGTGNIVLVETGVGTVETFNVATGLGDNGGTVSASGTQVTIDPGASLSNNTAYHVTIASTAVDDLVGNSFAGIADTTTWNFTSVASGAFIPSRDFSNARNTIYVVI